MRTDRVDLAEVGAAGEPMQRSADLKAGRMAVGLAGAARSGECRLRLRLLCGQCRQQAFDGAIAFIDLLEQELIGLKVLPKRKQVLGAIVASERGGDLGA